MSPSVVQDVALDAHAATDPRPEHRTWSPMLRRTLVLLGLMAAAWLLMVTLGGRKADATPTPRPPGSASLSAVTSAVPTPVRVHVGLTPTHASPVKPVATVASVVTRATSTPLSPVVHTATEVVRTATAKIPTAAVTQHVAGAVSVVVGRLPRQTGPAAGLTSASRPTLLDTIPSAPARTTAAPRTVATVRGDLTRVRTEPVPFAAVRPAWALPATTATVSSGSRIAALPSTLRVTNHRSAVTVPAGPQAPIPPSPLAPDAVASACTSVAGSGHDDAVATILGAANHADDVDRLAVADAARPVRGVDVEPGFAPD